MEPCATYQNTHHPSVNSGNWTTARQGLLAIYSMFMYIEYAVVIGTRKHFEMTN